MRQAQSNVWGWPHLFSYSFLFLGGVSGWPHEHVVSRRLKPPGSTLLKDWAKLELKKYCDALDKTAPKFKPSRSCEERISDTLLEGDSCSRCERKRASALESFRDVRSILKKQYVDKKGKEIGLTFG